MNWTAIGIFLTLALFVAKMAFDLTEYYRRKRDVLTDGDHEQVHAIKTSLREVSIEMGMLSTTLKMIDTTTKHIDGRLGKSENRLTKLELELEAQEATLAEITKKAQEHQTILTNQGTQVRNLQEAIRIVAIHHKNRHNEDLNIEKLL